MLVEINIVQESWTDELVEHTKVRKTGSNLEWTVNPSNIAATLHLHDVTWHISSAVFYELSVLTLLFCAEPTEFFRSISLLIRLQNTDRLIQPYLPRPSLKTEHIQGFHSFYHNSTQSPKHHGKELSAFTDRPGRSPMRLFRFLIKISILAPFIY